MRFDILTDNDAKGTVFIRARRRSFLISTKLDKGRVRNLFRRVNQSVNGLSKVLIARRRDSRVGNIKVLTEGCGLPVCTGRGA